MSLLNFVVCLQTYRLRMAESCSHKNLNLSSASFEEVGLPKQVSSSPSPTETIFSENLRGLCEAGRY